MLPWGHAMWGHAVWRHVVWRHVVWGHAMGRHTVWSWRHVVWSWRHALRAFVSRTAILLPVHEGWVLHHVRRHVRRDRVPERPHLGIWVVVGRRVGRVHTGAVRGRSHGLGRVRWGHSAVGRAVAHLVRVRWAHGELLLKVLPIEVGVGVRGHAGVRGRQWGAGQGQFIPLHGSLNGVLFWLLLAAAFVGLVAAERGGHTSLRPDSS